MVPVTKTYTFQGPSGDVTLKDLFGSKSQLIIYHHMFDPASDEGCHGCAFMVANFPDLRHLADMDTSLAVVSRAPIENITVFKEKNFWKFPWVSSFANDFNKDFDAVGESVARVEALDKEAESQDKAWDDQPGLTVLKLQDGQVYHTYSAYTRLDSLTATNAYLDLTLAGRELGPLGPAVFPTPAEYASRSD